MLNFIIAKAESSLGVPLDYLRYMASVSTRIVWRFSKVTGLGNCRKVTPKDAFHVACLAVTKVEDCGECVQIAINVAKRDGVSPAILRSVILGRPEELSEGLRKVHDFAVATTTAAGPADELREAVKSHYGEVALLEITLGTAAARVFPQVKRALGFAKACSVAPPTI